MAIIGGRLSVARTVRRIVWVLGASVILPLAANAQVLTGTLIVTVKDAQGGVLPGALVRLSSPAQMGGPVAQPTGENGQLRFPTLAPGVYVLEVELQGFKTYREENIPIGAAGTIERNVPLDLAGVAESLVVAGSGSRLEARNPGFQTRFKLEDLRSIPTRRASMFDFIRAAPGISPTSPTSGANTTVSAFGSGGNENLFLFDGTNFTCPCSGQSRSEPGIDFIQEIQVQSVGASVEFGNAQGAVINVVTRQGSEQFLADLSFYGQPAGLTSQPVLLPLPSPLFGKSGYERDRYRDLTTNVGGPILRGRLWFFAGYQHLRDYDSQPGVDPKFPRANEQDKIFVKLTWRLTPNLQLLQSFHDEFWVNAEQPTFTKPFEATVRPKATVPAMTFGHLTHSLSSSSVWDVRVGRFVYDREDPPSTGSRTTASRFDRLTGITSAAPASFGAVTLIRTNAKATVNHYRSDLWGVDHHWRFGVEVERGEHYAPLIIPTGTRYIDNGTQPFQAVSREPAQDGGVFLTTSLFVSDAITLGDRLTVNAGLRYDRSRAISQDLRALDSEGNETDAIVAGLGTLYTWNVFSPRLGATLKLSEDGRTILRGSYGRFRQGVLTGEISPFHPGVTPITTTAYDPATGGYTIPVSVVDPYVNLRLDPGIRAPRTDEYSIGVDREVTRQLAVAIAYVRKTGSDFIGWTDVGGQYREETRTMPDGRTVPVFALVNGTAARRFLLTNPAGYSLKYNALVLVAEKRRSRGWHAFASYTYSRALGLQSSSGTTAAGPQLSSIAGPTPVPFGQDPNSLTNAYGRLANDRPHVFRVMGSVDVPRSGIAVATNLQYFTGKPWAASAQVLLPQGDQRILLEPRGSRRLSSQTLVDLRVSRLFSLGTARIDLLVDVLNLLNDTAEEGLANDNFYSSTFGQPNVFIDPRRVMIGVRVNFGR